MHIIILDDNTVHSKFKTRKKAENEWWYLYLIGVKSKIQKVKRVKICSRQKNF